MRPFRRTLPFFFGPVGKLLFGCYHEPQSTRTRKCSIVICQPAGHEYVNSHRALRELAGRLCDAGFPVLRFDYYGCGDSSGEAEDAAILQWLDDISVALKEVRHRTGIDQVCIVGLRLGGTLALMSSVQHREIGSLVLWDPIINGKTHLNELQLLQKEMLRCRPKPRYRAKPQDYIEVLGFPFSNVLCEQLQALDLLAMDARPVHNILMLQSYPAPLGNSLRRRLSQSQANVEHKEIQAPPIWQPTSDGSLQVPYAALQTAVSWISKTYS